MRKNVRRFDVSGMREGRRRKRIYIFATLGFLALYFLALGIFSFFARTPFFRVAHVSVTGTQSVAQDDVLAVVQSAALAGHPVHDVLGIGNILSWPSDLSLKQLALIPEASSVEVSKDYFDRSITIDVTERTPYAIWCFEETRGGEAGSACYWFDEGGTLFKRATGVEGGAIPVIDDLADRETGLGAKILPAEFLPNFLSILKLLDQIGIRGITVHLADLGLEEVSVNEPAGPELKFSLKFSASNLGNFLVSFMNRSGWKNLQYVDFRVENRVYYK